MSMRENIDAILDEALPCTPGRYRLLNAILSVVEQRAAGVDWSVTTSLSDGRTWLTITRSADGSVVALSCPTDNESGETIQSQLVRQFASQHAEAKPVADVSCQSCGSAATRRLMEDATSFPGLYCDGCSAEQNPADPAHACDDEFCPDYTCSWQPADPLQELADESQRLRVAGEELISDLRMYAGNDGYSHGDYADTMSQAAARIASLEAELATAMQLGNSLEQQRNELRQQLTAASERLDALLFVICDGLVSTATEVSDSGAAKIELRYKDAFCMANAERVLDAAIDATLAKKDDKQ